MKTEDLKALGLSQEQIDGVFKLHGKDIEKYQGVESENESLKKQIKDKDRALENAIKESERRLK